jgi:hypothetical protein
VRTGANGDAKRTALAIDVKAHLHISFDPIAPSDLRVDRGDRIYWNTIATQIR